METFEELAYLRGGNDDPLRAEGYYFFKPIFLEELKTSTRPVGDVRAGIGSRERARSRAAYSRAG